MGAKAFEWFLNLRRRDYLALALAFIGAVAAFGLKDTFGTGRGRDFVDPSVVELAYQQGEQRGRLDYSTHSGAADLIVLSKRMSEAANQSGSQKVEWKRAFSRGYLDGWMAERKARERNDHQIP